ncbi:hypothetical protein BEL04_14020 [Mucilaginibacter sp. PPCGB 2223]|uniref:sigma-70 family RNA polymerase sigma factor n=1 Tax=Mucilaginibacter sp. PPCGB 2223 TaxID=1886027 RepID=UPI0008253CDD|nr:sigma-70 family RNA polymerase sigma factor [Mucilaginibacter sp. PPCGB 2223]OCX52565.1 hypothetical protein BEL04_14020 [Mucilaginibacter sp. PPCGB 2223]
MKINLSDEELLLRLQQGDIQAYNEIFNRYWKKLYGIAYNRLRTKEASEDVVQDILVSLWTRREELKVVNLSYYLGTSIRYAVFRQLNKLHEKIQVDTKILQADTSLSEPEEFQLMDYHILKQYLNKEVNKLPEKCQIVFKYSRDQHLSNKKIAEIMNLSEKTVEAHITKALKHLKVALKGFFLLILPFLYS